MGRSYDDETARFASTFSPGEHRWTPPRDWVWLGGGLPLLVAGIGILWVSWLSFDGSLPLNDFVGIRTPDTLAGVDVWRRSQRAAAPATFAGGLSLLAGGGWLLLRRPPARRARIAGAIAAALFGALVIVAGFLANGAASS